MNNKGGVGKTTSTLSIAEILARAGYTVLTIDLDPQLNLSKVLDQGSYQETELDFTSLLCSDLDIDTLMTQYIRETEYENISVIPGTKKYKKIIHTIAAEIESDKNSVLHFKNNLSKLDDYYDYILIDNSPFDSELETCSICASNNILTPIQASNYSYDGLLDLIKSISTINNDYNLEVKFLGIFMTQVMTRSRLFKSLFESYREQFGDKFITVSISHSVLLDELSTEYVPLLSYDKKSKAAKEYIDLVNYIGLLDNEHYKTLMDYIGASKTKKGAQGNGKK